jgi:hypothetical protein
MISEEHGMRKMQKPSIEDALNLISEGQLDLLPDMAAAYRDEVMQLLEGDEESSDDDEVENEAA